MLSPVDVTRDFTPVKRREFVRALRSLHDGGADIGLRFDREGSVNSDGIEVYYYDVGPVDASLTLVYVHGFNIAAEEFYMQFETPRPLVRQLLVDLRGHGQTGCVDPRLLTIDAAADDIACVLRALLIDGPLITIGHSLGSPVSLSLMRRHDFNWAGSMQISGAVDPFTAQGASAAARRGVRHLAGAVRGGAGEQLRTGAGGTPGGAEAKPLDVVRLSADRGTGP